MLVGGLFEARVFDGVQGFFVGASFPLNISEELPG